MLLGNYNKENRSPGRFFAGVQNSDNRSNWNTSGAARNKFLALDQRSSVPDGYSPPYTTVISVKSGGMATFVTIQGVGAITSNMASGKALSADLAGVGTLTPPSMALLVQLAATILGDSDLSADMTGLVQLASTLAGSGDLEGSLTALAFCVATLAGDSDLSADMFGTASLSANITSQTALSPESLAGAVWNALAADFDTAGTMGEKMNNAASAGDPWSTPLPGAYADGTAGKIVGSKLLTLAKFLGLK